MPPTDVSADERVHVRGNATAEELAAVAVVLAMLSQGEPEPDRTHCGVRQD